MQHDRDPDFFDALTYRIPILVEEYVVHINDGSYPVCPRCGQSIDREYMGYCDRCGQCLDWTTYHSSGKCHSDGSDSIYVPPAEGGQRVRLSKNYVETSE